MVLSFEDKYNLLKEYLQKHDNKYPLRRAIYKNFNIYNWVKDLTKIYFEGERDYLGNINYNEEILSINEIEMLDKLGFPWGINSHKSFQRNLYLLKDYLRKNNNEYPKYKTFYNGVNISSWVNILKNSVENGEKLEDGSFRHPTKDFILTKKQYELLLDMNFVFEGAVLRETSHRPISEPSNDFFEEGYNLLLEYISKTKKHPTTCTIYKNYNLGYFVTKIRVIYKYGERQDNGDIIYKTLKLKKQDLEKLDEVDFPYVTETYMERWLRHYNSLLQYKDTHGGKFPTGDSAYKYDFLRNWMSNQRVIFNTGDEQEDGSIKKNNSILRKNQIDLLNRIDFPFVINKQKFINKEIETTEDMIKKRRYLINELLKLKDIEFEHRIKQDYIVKKYIKSIYEK